MRVTRPSPGLMSFRPSSAHSIRASHAGLSGTNASASSATAQKYLTDKKKEYDALNALEGSTAELIRRMEAMAEDSEAMASAGKGTANLPLYIFFCSSNHLNVVHGDVLAQWPQMFRILGLFCTCSFLRALSFLNAR